MRRLASAIVTAALSIPALPTPTASAAPSTLQTLLDGRLASFSGGAAIVVEDPQAATIVYAHEPDEVVVAASLYKLGVLLEAERRVDAGTLTYATTITIEAEDVTEDGAYEFPGTVLTLDETLEKMITISDNGAALALLRILGAHRINLTLASLGIAPFTMAEDPSEDYAASPRALATYFTLLAQKKLLSAAASERMLQRLERQQINDRLPATLPSGTVVAHKTGNLGFVTHDAGIIYGATREPMVVVAMTWNSGEGEAIELIRDVGSLVYAHTLGSPANATISAPQQPLSVEAGRAAVQSVSVTNLGPKSWSASGPGSFGLTWEMKDAGGKIVARSAPLLPLGQLAASRASEFPLVLPVPARAGDYTVTVGLADESHGALASLGGATATFTLRAYAPQVASLGVSLSPLLHRGEPSPAFVTLRPLAGLTATRTLSLGWRLLDRRSHQIVRQGTSALGPVKPGTPAMLLVPFAVPGVRGEFTLELFAVLDGEAVSATVAKDVEVAGARTYPGELVPGASSTPAPRPSPSPVPRPGRTPAGKTPAP